MITYGSCAAAIPETRGIPLPTTPRSRPGDDIVSRLERKHSRVSPIVLRNDNPEVWAKPNKTAKVLRARESVKRTRVPIDPTPIIAAYQAGQSISAIARAQKRAQDTITNVLRANGIPTRRAAPPASVDEATRAAIIASTKAGATHRETAALVGVREYTARRVWAKSGETRDADVRIPAPHAISPAKVDRIIAAYQAGSTAPQAASRYGVSVTTTYQILRNAGIDLRNDRITNHSGGPPRISDDVRAKAIGLYLAGDTAQDVADTLGVSKTFVARLVKAAGHSRPTTSARTRGVDNAGALRELMRVNGITGREVRAWARATGRPCPSNGIPPRALTEDYLLTRTIPTQEGTPA